MRLFVAVWPPPEVMRALRGFPRPALPRVRYTTEPQWHVTLAFLGEVPEPEPVVGAVRVAAASMAGPATADLGPTAELLGRQVLCVPVRGLEELAAAVRRETAAWSPPDEGRPFMGHLTLARAVGRSRVPTHAAGATLSARWQVDSVSVVASQLDSSGARYHDVDSTRLGPPAGPTISTGGHEGGR